MTRADLMRLRQRGPDGAVLDDPPLFLDEVVAAVARHRRPDGGLVQLDMKDPPERLDDAAVARLREVLGAHARHFIAGSTDAGFLDRLRAAMPELTRGFDPLALYGFGAAIARATAPALRGSPTRWCASRPTPRSSTSRPT